MGTVFLPKVRGKKTSVYGKQKSCLREDASGNGLRPLTARGISKLFFSSLYHSTSDTKCHCFTFQNVWFTYPVACLDRSFAHVLLYSVTHPITPCHFILLCLIRQNLHSLHLFVSPFHSTALLSYFVCLHVFMLLCFPQPRWSLLFTCCHLGRSFFGGSGFPLLDICMALCPSFSVYKRASAPAFCGHNPPCQCFQ